LIVPLYSKIDIHMTEMIRKKILPLKIVLLFLTAAVFLPDVWGQVQNAPAGAPEQYRSGQNATGKAPGQKPGQAPGQAPVQGNGTVKGSIKDSTTAGGIEYATVGLYRQKDSTLVNGIVTDPSGTFVLKGIPNGQFYLDVNFIGYIKKRIHNITVTPQAASVDLGSIPLHPNITQIGDVQVIAQSNRVSRSSPRATGWSIKSTKKWST
jgi:hypothetical protein